eukprot:scaffold849_cov386-Prasinococcus_capsulatus_cf.AAC.14
MVISGLDCGSTCSSHAIEFLVKSRRTPTISTCVVHAYELDFLELCLLEQWPELGNLYIKQPYTWPYAAGSSAKRCLDVSHQVAYLLCIPFNWLGQLQNWGPLVRPVFHGHPLKTRWFRILQEALTKNLRHKVLYEVFLLPIPFLRLAADAHWPFAGFTTVTAAHAGSSALHKREATFQSLGTPSEHCAFPCTCFAAEPCGQEDVTGLANA